MNKLLNVEEKLICKLDNIQVLLNLYETLLIKRIEVQTNSVTPKKKCRWDCLQVTQEEKYRIQTVLQYTQTSHFLSESYRDSDFLTNGYLAR